MDIFITQVHRRVFTSMLKFKSCGKKIQHVAVMLHVAVVESSVYSYMSYSNSTVYVNNSVA